ncbi:hypothetical protein O6149_24640, partial [Salmonella enterica subsp. enterica]
PRSNYRSFFLSSDSSEDESENAAESGERESGQQGNDGGSSGVKEYTQEDFDKVQQDGFRYLGLTADKSMNLSPREYQNMMIGRN